MKVFRFVFLVTISCNLCVAMLHLPAIATELNGPQVVPPTPKGAPTDAQREKFRTLMAGVKPPGHGCYKAQYPTPKWVKVNCGPAPKYPNPISRVVRPNVVGSGTDYFTNVNGNIASATGSFDTVVNVGPEYGNKGGDLTTVAPNIYSLQLNANKFDTTACGGSAGCSGWEQFIYSQSQCGGGACIFIEYWLLEHKPPCPSDASWEYYDGSVKDTVPGCFLNTAIVSVPVQGYSDFGKIKLTGTANADTDDVTLSTASGLVYVASNASVANLSQGWTGAEYNVFGDCCVAEAYFPSTASFTVRLTTTSASQAAPTCTNSDF
jgi:hypothetical protein